MTVLYLIDILTREIYIFVYISQSVFPKRLRNCLPIFSEVKAEQEDQTVTREFRYLRCYWSPTRRPYLLPDIAQFFSTEIWKLSWWTSYDERLQHHQPFAGLPDQSWRQAHPSKGPIQLPPFPDLSTNLRAAMSLETFMVEHEGREREREQSWLWELMARAWICTMLVLLEMQKWSISAHHLTSIQDPGIPICYVLCPSSAVVLHMCALLYYDQRKRQ